MLLSGLRAARLAGIESAARRASRAAVRAGGHDRQIIDGEGPLPAQVAGKANHQSSTAPMRLR
jgi:hypothetical protein